MVANEDQRGRLVRIRFEFLPRKAYKDKFDVTPAAVLNYFESTFIHKVLIPVLNTTVKDRMKKIVVESFEGDSEMKRAPSRGSEEGDNLEKRMDQIDRNQGGEGHASSDEDEAPEDADATEERKRKRQADDGGDRGEEGLSDEEAELVADLAKRLEADQEGEDENDDFSAPGTPSRSGSIVDRSENTSPADL